MAKGGRSRGGFAGIVLRMQTARLDRDARKSRTLLRGALDLGKRLYVGNLPFSSTEEELREAFGTHGTVAGVDVIMDRDTGRPRGFAFVEMEDPAAADAAIQALDGSDFGGRNLRVNEAQERRGGGGRR